MRDKLGHDYMGVDLEAVWLTIGSDLGQLKNSIELLLSESGPESQGE